MEDSSLCFLRSIVVSFLFATLFCFMSSSLVYLFVFCFCLFVLWPFLLAVAINTSNKARSLQPSMTEGYFGSLRVQLTSIPTNGYTLFIVGSSLEVDIRQKLCRGTLLIQNQDM